MSYSLDLAVNFWYTQLALKRAFTYIQLAGETPMFDWKSGRVKRSAVADPLQTLIPVRDYEGARASFKLNAGMFFVFFAVFSLAYYMFSSLAHIAEVSAWPFDLLYSGYTILGFVALCRMYHNILRAKKHIIEREKEVRAEMR